MCARVWKNTSLEMPSEVTPLILTEKCFLTSQLLYVSKSLLSKYVYISKSTNVTATPLGGLKMCRGSGAKITPNKLQPSPYRGKVWTQNQLNMQAAKKARENWHSWGSNAENRTALEACWCSQRNSGRGKARPGVNISNQQMQLITSQK